MVCSLHTVLLREEMEECVVFDRKKWEKATEFFWKLEKVFLREVEGLSPLSYGKFETAFMQFKHVTKFLLPWR